uniref:LRRCT domain-containing protein n=1 Tax=Branchiostoma floridae TaxID=7739 RepID=C3XWN0_BRAFL|eukprot:XP_002611130.1 hypothetical protein BRAFLDRAFT_88471 [Branchiostoma floridae]
MGRKLRHLLMFLLIILKEPNMPDAGRTCTPSSVRSCAPPRCYSSYLGLTSIPLNLPSSITDLYLNHNNIAMIREGAFVNLPQLQKLSLHKNQITMIQEGAFVNLPQLQKLSLSYNQITLIQEGTFVNLAQLQELKLSHNKITMLQNGAFVNLPQLKTLFLSYNNIAMIREGVFVNVPQLQYLNLFSNQITKIQPDAFANLPGLRVLSLSHNKITKIKEDAFANLSGLRVLWLGKNKITTINPGIFANLPWLEKLHLWGNQITLIQEGTFVNLAQLQELDLSNNKITLIPPGAFAKFTLLQVLLLTSNKITLIQKGTFVNLTRLRKLSLYYNQITMIQPGAFANLPGLLELNLSRNKITKIKEDAFANLSGLRELWLVNNKITTIKPGIFAKIPQLQKLYLTNNKMSAIAPLAFSLLPCNLDIHLDRNPWQCDCKMVPFRLDSTEFPSFKDQIFCTEPANLRGQKLTDVSPEDLVCAETTTSVLPVDVQVTLKFNNSYKGTTADSTVKNKKDKTRPTIASTLQSNSFHADTQITSNDYYNSTTADLKAGIALIGTVILTIWCKRRTKNPPPGSSSGPNSNIALRRLNMTGTVVINGHYYQTGQDQSQTITQSHANTTAVVVASGLDHQYEDIGRHTNLRQGQSQTITDSNTNTVATVMTSAHDHQYEDVDNHHNQADQGQSLVNTKPLKVENLSHHDHDQTGHCQSQAANESLESRNLSYGTGPTASQQNVLYKVVGQFEATNKSISNSTANVVTSGHDHQYEDITQHDKIEQGQSLVKTKSLKVGNLSHDEVLAALDPNPMYADVGALPNGQTSTAMISGQGQTGQGQSQAIAEHYTNTTAAVVTSGHDHQYIHVDNDHDQTGQGQSQAIAESLESRNLSYGTGPTASQQNALYKVVGQSEATNKSISNSTATVVTSGHDHTKLSAPREVFYSTGPPYRCLAAPPTRPRTAAEM